MNDNLEVPSLVSTPQGAQKGNYFPEARRHSTASPTHSDNASAQQPPEEASTSNSDNRKASASHTVDSRTGTDSLRQQLEQEQREQSRERNRTSTTASSIPRDADKDAKGKQREAPERASRQILPKLSTKSIVNRGKPKSAERAGSTMSPKQQEMKDRQSGQRAPIIDGSAPSMEQRETSVSLPQPRPESKNSTNPPGQPFSLAGVQQPSTSKRKRRSSVRYSHSQAPIGVAMPAPQPKEPPAWARRKSGAVYSLGKPLPTKEEVDAQKEWEEQMDVIKKQYPGAEPPAPPPLPSQQTSVTASLPGLDPEQLTGLIRSVIAEYHGYQAGQTRASTTSSQKARVIQRSSLPLATGSQATAAERQQKDDELASIQEESEKRQPDAGGSGLSRLDSLVVEDEEGLPIEEEEMNRGYRSRRTSLDMKRPRPQRHSKEENEKEAQEGGAGMPAVPAGGAGEIHHNEQEDIPALPAQATTSEARSPRKRNDSEDSVRTTDFIDRSVSPSKQGPYENGDITAVNSRTSSGTHSASSAVRYRANRKASKQSGDSASSPAEEGASEVFEQDFALDEDGEEEGYESEDDEFPNPIAKLRAYIREPAAEFLGAFILSIIGTGANIQAGITSNPAISPSGQASLANTVYLSAPLAWGIAVAISVYIAGGISGGHISPVISIMLAAFRGFPWSKVPVYILAQILGFTAGSGTAYGLYRRAISIVQGGPGIRTIGTNGTANYFGTFPLEYLSNANAWFQEFVNTMVLVVLILAIGDAASGVPPPAGLNPIVIMFTVTAIGLGLGIQTGYCLNPARDLGPRLVSWWAGYGTDVFSFRDQYWLWCCWLADIAGGLFGAVLYDTLIFTGRESPLNWKWKFRDLHPQNVWKRAVGWYRHRKASFLRPTKRARMLRQEVKGDNKEEV